jgi:D-alanyl-D-alanine carboxypeptidase/D-alanyl-D-alanine-endopeptidase (penicillin-binding protein 4)
MRKKNTLWANMKLISLLFLVVFFSTSIFSQDIKDFIEGMPNQEAFWSINVLDENGNRLESINEDKLIIPASNQKLYTLAAVLDRLGSNYRYYTNIYGSDNVTDSTYYGDIIIRGTGDPSISGFLYNEDRFHVFSELTKDLKSNGINTITGSLIGNVSFFDDQVFPLGWDWYDLSFYYGVEIAPLSFNNNTVDLIVRAEGDVGNKPQIEWFPSNSNYVEFINEQVITTKGTKYYEDYRKDLGDNSIYLGSKLPQGYVEKESLAITDAANYFLHSFDAFLNSKGIKTSSSFGIQNYNIPDYWVNYKVLASHSSKPLSELIKWANKESDNFYTEMLLKTLAAEISGIPGTFEEGIKEVRIFLAEQGLDTNLVKMNDGSGLAMGNYTSTGNISTLLYSMKTHKEADVFYNSFPIAGIDGSIAHRFKGTPLYNNVRAKTGYVSGVRTLSGYLNTASGKEITFSLATNHFIGKVSPIDNSHQKILEYLYAKY